MSRLGGPTHGIVTKSVHKTLPGSLFYLSETGPCGDISSSDLFPIYRRSSLLSLLHVFTYFVWCRCCQFKTIQSKRLHDYSCLLPCWHRVSLCRQNRTRSGKNQGHLDSKPFDHCRTKAHLSGDQDTFIDIVYKHLVLPGIRFHQSKQTVRQWRRGESQTNSETVASRGEIPDFVISVHQPIIWQFFAKQLLNKKMNLGGVSP